MLKNVSIGVNDFKKLIEENFYYVDKTLVIEEVIKNNNMVSVITRPKSFGKSLFISMLDNFFNIEKKDINKNLFKDLNISKSKYLYDYYIIVVVFFIKKKDFSLIRHFTIQNKHINILYSRR